MRSAPAATQINEKSLRLIARELSTGERAEAYLRFPAGPQNLLTYRELRVWMRGRGPGGRSGELQAFIKLGSDDHNFYLYRAPAAHHHLGAGVGDRPRDVWRDLRAEVEKRWLRGRRRRGPPSAGPTTRTPTWPARARTWCTWPTRGSIRPTSPRSRRSRPASIGSAGRATAPEAELWVDDIRLASPVSETGTAVSFDTRLVASDVGSVSASFTRQDGQFRQINVDPTYRTTSGLCARHPLAARSVPPHRTRASPRR